MENNETKIWDGQLLFKIEESLKDLPNLVFNPQDIEVENQASQDLLQADKKYKHGHNEFTYVLWWILCIFGFLLIIPAYWLVKKIKQLRKNKKELLDNISEKEKKLLDVRKEIAKNIDVLAINKLGQDVIRYQFKGPIPEELIQYMQSLSLDSIAQNPNQNTYKTSWGIFEDKIVIHAHEQDHICYNKTYSNSVTVSYRDGDTTRSEIVSASITKPAYKVTTQNNTFAFMTSCSNLEFTLEGVKRRLIDMNFNKKNNYSPMDNKIFEDKTKWIRNDETQFRMIFTPWTQETFVKETNKCKNITSEWEWAKTGAYLYNEFRTDAHVVGKISYFYNSIQKFITSPRFTRQELINAINESIKKYFHDIYKSMNFMWATTIMPSENHQFIIKSINDKFSIGESNLSLIAHKLLASYHNYNIAGANMETFPKLYSVNTRNIGGYNFYESCFKTKSYEIVRKVENVVRYASLANKSVVIPIWYDDYIPLESWTSIWFAYIPSSICHYKFGNKLISNVSHTKLLDLLTSNNIQYNNGFLSFNKNSNINDNVLQEIIDLINKYNNSNMNSNIQNN